ncbi:T9SS type A sorting domain-containing protein [uncultured Fluviicola sp.]|uniref:T9SS type A sorting domain-containing protein n=1 Tax=uncultured Fluviicola sp. TaxID=463303 RepID=UPI0025E336F3|nr:T9SS type A sorting domain-containing protein [uncultured Fluviicola sp.]
MTKKIALILGLLVFSLSAFSQAAPFNIYLEPMNISGLGGLQAFAWGQHQGKWLIIGGRLDGLHRRQPFAAFDEAGHNNQLIVVDPVAQQKWSAPLSSLPIGLQEQLSATNMEFYQEGDYLYLVGGYGYSNTSADHITYPNLSAVKVPDVIDAIINGTSFASSFRQVTDTLFAVTGGYLNKINNTFYLTGGQKFIGRYNPMGPTHGPGFIQEYTNASRKFTLSDDGVTLSVTHLAAIHDPANLHRRDYNVVPQIMPAGQEGLTAFSGVFQVNADLPFLNCVNIDSTGHTVNNAFSQYYNHYHCAHIPLYSASNNEMHTVFFGGIAQYYDSLGVLVQDNNVPFVKTIARVTRNASGTMAEYKLPVEMPALLGAGSEFIPIETVPHYDNDVLKLDDFTTDTTLVGFIYGGISSTAANIFFTNTGTESSASSQLFKVYVIQNSTLGIHNLNDQSTGTLKIQVFPNPNDGNFVVKFHLNKPEETKISLYHVDGKKIEERVLTDLVPGENTFQRKIRNLDKGGTYILTIETPHEKATQRIVIEP